MTSLIIGSSSLPTKVKSNLKLTLKLKSPEKISDVTVTPKKKLLKQQSLNKLSTLDNWLGSSYKSNTKRNNATPFETKKIREDHTNVEELRRLIVRLEKVNLLEFKQRIENKNKTIIRKRAKISGLTYKDRTSQYIRLPTKEYKCVKCDYTHRNLVSVTSHYDKKHSEHIFKCELCPFETKQQYYFNTHVRFHSKPDVECPHCKKMIKNFSYKMHIKTHERNDKTEYKCDVCDYRSYNHANVKRHKMTIHKDPHELQTFNCDSCDYVTVLQERLKIHKKQVHSKDGVWIQCPHCEYTTRRKAHMDRHTNDLHGGKSVPCPECSQRFTSKVHLNNHMKRMHVEPSEKKFYYCEMCPKEEQYKTTEKGNLARHVLAHRTLDEIEVFACHKCPYLGKSRSALKIHLINAHLPELHAYKCQICGYSTSTKSRYRLHRYVHGKPRENKHNALEIKESPSSGEADKSDGDLTAITNTFNADSDVEVKEEDDHWN